MNRTFGVDIVPHNTGSYSHEIYHTTKAIAKITGKSEAHAYQHLQDASLLHKQRSGRSLHTSDEVTQAFAHDIAKVTGKSVHEVEPVLRAHLDSAEAVKLVGG